MKIKTQQIYLPILNEKNVQLFIKRIDKIYDCISGNKWYKLKYNIIEAKRKAAKSILTFGGAYSNHIAATACLAKKNGLNSIGIIRGEKNLPLNTTLRLASKNGMEIHYVSRSDYRLKDSNDFLEKLKFQFGDIYIIPEGGTNKLGIKGASMILDDNDNQNYICCSVGTGGTFAGIINSKEESQKVMGFAAIKGSFFLQENIEKWTENGGWKLFNDYSYGGYAKVNRYLIDFVNNFYLTQNIPLDVIYTGKMMMAILDLIGKNYFEEGSTILAIHTGGLQGNLGFSERLGINLPK